MSNSDLRPNVTDVAQISGREGTLPRENLPM